MFTESEVYNCTNEDEEYYYNGNIECTADNTLKNVAYDGNDNTFATYNVFTSNSVINKNGYLCRFNVDETTWKENIRCRLKFNIYMGTIGYDRKLTLFYLDNNDSVIDTYMTATITTGKDYTIKVKIPENTKSVIIYSDLYLSIYEVKMEKQDILDYPILTESGICNRVNNDGKYYFDNNVECNASDALKKSGYDGNTNTYVNGNNLRLDIHKSAIGKTLSTIISQSGAWRTVNIYDNNGNLAKFSPNMNSGSFGLSVILEFIYTIPNNAAYILFGYNVENVYEVRFTDKNTNDSHFNTAWEVGTDDFLWDGN